MSEYLPIFITNLARSGSGLVDKMLSTNPGVTVADAFIDLFRSMRNTFIQVGAPPDLQQSFDPASPMQDYYFTDERIGLLDVVQAGELSAVMPEEEWEQLLERSIPRTKLTCAELVPYLSQLKATNYKGMFDNALEIIAKARNAYDCKWIGIKESWCIEFFASLARTYPEAKFIVILRDPRATINSMLGAVNKDPANVAHALSYARHWRKYVAFITRYQNDPIFSDRLYVLTHEQVLKDPARKAMDLCDFLDVEYYPEMTDTDNFIDYATGNIWRGNSSFEEVTSGFSAHRAERWREMLDPRALSMVEFTCGPDMKLMGYEPTAPINDHWPHSDVLEYLVQSSTDYAKWRSDFGDPQKDYGFELFRHALVTQADGSQDPGLIRRSFLFEEVFTQLRRLAVESTAII